MIVVMCLDEISGELVAGPDIVSRGFVYMKESEDLIEEARLLVQETVEGYIARHIADWGKIKSGTKDALSEFVWKKTKRRPMILPVIQEV